MTAGPVTAGARGRTAGLKAAGHVILIGLPGAGKSTVGPHVARALRRTFFDFDGELERRAGRSVAEQFAAHGEPAFRAAEAALSRELALAEPAVLAPGGGWAANPAARAALGGARHRTVYLCVPPQVAAARLATECHTRPLLAGARDPVDAVDALLTRRRSLYEAADLVVDATGAPEAVAEAVVAAVGAWVTVRG